MLLVYTHKITPRVTYIFKTIFEDIIGSKVSFTNDESFFMQSNLPKINYSHTAIPNSLHFPSVHLLFENTIKDQNIEVFDDTENLKGFFRITNGVLFSFDVFSASFYLLTRYEEYLSHKTDEHQRFLASESLAFKHNFLKFPIINHWVTNLVAFLVEKYPHLKIAKKQFTFISTLDIDNAFAIKNKSILRTVGGIAKASKSKNDTIERIKILTNNKKDPYDTFDEQEKIHQKYNLNPIYFFLVGDYAKYDKNCSIENKDFQHLIKKISITNLVGLHPSYRSNENYERLTMEKQRLEKCTNKIITKSRQHFLKLKFPETYLNLIKAGINEDYTMGFADENGFRASIASPFYFYDLKNEKTTTLKIVPFCVMEATFKYYKKSSPTTALKEILEIINEVKKVNGTFVSVWHNESLSDEGSWKGWKEVYEKMVEELLIVNC